MAERLQHNPPRLVSVLPYSAGRRSSARDQTGGIMAKNTAVFGIFRDTAALGGGLDHLKAAGFRNTDISVLMPENLGTKDSSTKRKPRLPKAQPRARSPAP